jgi:hypothetical protein
MKTEVYRREILQEVVTFAPLEKLRLAPVVDIYFC